MELYQDKITIIRAIPQVYTLITDSQDVREVLAHIGKPELYEEGYTGLFVLTDSGSPSGYRGIYAFAGTVPYLSTLVRKIL